MLLRWAVGVALLLVTVAEGRAVARGGRSPWLVALVAFDVVFWTHLLTDLTR